MKIVGVKLRKNGRVYDFVSGHFVLKKGDKVIVETEQGQAMGIVCIEPKIPGDDFSTVLKSNRYLEKIHIHCAMNLIFLHLKNTYR